MIPTVLAVVPALVCAASWYGVGCLVPRRWLVNQGRLLAAVTRFGLGAAVLALGMYFAGRIGLYERWFLIPVTLAFAGYGLYRERDLWRRRPAVEPLGRAAGWTLVAAAVAGLLTVIATSTPPVAVDTVRYHLALPELWLSDGEVTDAFWRWESFNPFTSEMLGGQGLAIGGSSAAGAVSGLLAVLAFVVVFGLARELGGGSVLVGAVGAFLFVFQGVVTSNVLASYVEVPLALYAGLAGWHALRFVRGAGVQAAVWAGVFAGCAGAVKYPGLFAGGLVVAATAVVALRRREPRTALLTVGAACAVPLPWYLKNLVVAGNPVYPFGRLEGKYLDTVRAPMDTELATASQGWDPQSPLPLLYLPVELILHSGSYGAGQFVGPIVFLLALAAVFLIRRRLVLVVALMALVYIFFWFSTAPQARFLIPVLVVLSALGALTVALLLERGRLAKVLGVAALAASALLWLPVALQPLAQRVPVAMGYEDVEKYIDRRTGTYRAFERLSRSAENTVITVGYPMIMWYPDRAIAFGSTQFEIGLPADVLWARLQENDVRSVIVQDGGGHLGWIEPLKSCLRQVDEVDTISTYGFTTQAIAIKLVLYSLDRCRERFEGA